MVQSSVWGLEFTLFSPIHHPNSSDLASKMSFQKKKTLFGCFGPFFSWTKLQKFTLTSYTLLLRSVLYSSAPHCASFLPWSCTQSWISSSHWALLPVQVFKVHNLQRQAQIYVPCSLSWYSMSRTVGKPFSSPLAAFFLIPAPLW